MSIEETNVIDFVSIDLSGDAVLTISDHLEWDEENQHLFLLQNKINHYLDVIESGSLHKIYPNIEGRNIVIQIIARHNPNKTGSVFLERMSDFLKNSGFGFLFKHID